MKNFILKTLAFFLFFACFYSIGLILTGKLFPSTLRPNLKHGNNAYGTTYNMLEDLRKSGKVDVLIVGASDAYRGYDPRIFSEYGIRAFNMGTSSQTPRQSLLLLEKYLDTLKPEILVYEVSPVCMTLDGIESSIDMIINNYDDKDALKLVAQNPDITLFNSYIYNLLAKRLFPVKTKGSLYESAFEKYIGAGYVEIVSENKKGESLDSSIWVPSPEQIEKFEDILQLASSRKLPLLLVNANNKTDLLFKNKASIDSFFASKGEYFDLNRFVKLNDTADFYDNSHLVKSGVKIMDNYFIEHILKNKLK